jgi:hypothetical protein
MIHQSFFVSIDHFNSDRYANSLIRERTLNTAIVQASISRGFEEYLEIIDTFYADDVKATSDTGGEPIQGRERLRSTLLNFLIPLHVMAEVGGLSVSVRETAIAGDAAGEMHSAWTLELVGISGKACTLTWRTLRRWDGGQVVYEHHYDHKQIGGPLTFDDLSLNVSKSVDEPRLPS